MNRANLIANILKTKETSFMHLLCDENKTAEEIFNELPLANKILFSLCLLESDAERESVIRKILALVFSLEEPIENLKAFLIVSKLSDMSYDDSRKLCSRFFYRAHLMGIFVRAIHKPSLILEDAERLASGTVSYITNLPNNDIINDIIAILQKKGS